MTSHRRTLEAQYGVVSRRAMVLGGGLGLAFVGLGAQLWRLQVVENEEFRTLSEGNQFNFQPLPSPRGRIFDRHGVPVADNEEVYQVRLRRDRADPEMLARLLDLVDPEDGTGAGAARRSARATRWDGVLRRARRFDEVLLEDAIDWQAFARVNLALPELPGVRAQSGLTRRYGLPGATPAERRSADAFAHVIGYIAKPSEEATEERLSAFVEPAARAAASRIVRHPAYRMGRAGLERTLDDALQGQWGELRVEVDAIGRVVRDIGVDQPAVAGRDLTLTIDGELQAYCHNRLEGESGAVAVVDVDRGDILALVSAPAFDPNRFARGIEVPAYRALSNDQRLPLYNKPLAGLYPPGSTFKMVVALAAMRAGIFNPREAIRCRGSVWLGNREFHCWKDGGHGSLAFHEAMKRSCDVYFYETARRVGIEAIAEEARRFGLGSAFPLEAPGSKDGIVPDPAWKRAVRGQPWAQGETLNVGIGQGAVLASPLQLAIMTARMVNGGKPVTPRILADAPLPDLAAAPPIADLEHLERIKAAMIGVVHEPGGTAFGRFAALGGLDLPGDIRAGGKTGTSQVRNITPAERARGVFRNEDLPWRRRDHALFVAFAPADAPRYAMALIIEHGGSGSAAAAPPSRDILRETVRLGLKLDAPPTPLVRPA